MVVISFHKLVFENLKTIILRIENESILSIEIGMIDGILYGVEIGRETERIRIHSKNFAHDNSLHSSVDTEKSHEVTHNFYNKDFVVENLVMFMGTHHSLATYNSDHDEHRFRKTHTRLVHSVWGGWKNFENR
ncbi:hypothetical protein Tco_1129951 [Tanacetum coccineum]